MSILRSRTLGLAAAALLGVGTLAAAGPGASADPKATFSAARAQARQCHAGAAAGQRGVDSYTVTAPSTGLVRARLTPVDDRSADGDWDLAVFDTADKRVVAASAGFRSNEIADGYVTAGEPLLVQGCRYAGDAARVNVSVTFVAAPATARAAADPVQVVSVNTPTRADKNRLGTLGLDDAEMATETTVDVVVHGRDDAAKLRENGYTWTVKVPDVGRYLAQVREQDAKFAAATPRSALPSGRTTYRRLADYDFDMKDLARRFPWLVSTFTLPKRSFEGRDIGGVEIALNPTGKNDGKPIFVNMGVHHAREWPAGEHPMEWAFDLAQGFGHDERTTRLVLATRNIVIPIVNVDGFSVSREAPPLGDFSTFDYEMKRKTCDPSGSPDQTGLCPSNSAGRTRGTDPNRNYGGFWGGNGASTNWRSDTYRGTAPFSEPEVEGVREFFSGRQVTNMITNHTASDLVIRPPGMLATGRPVDEPVLSDLGAKMVSHNGYANIFGWQLYDTTGTTEDWSYWVTGGLGYTFEIGPSSFHPDYATGVVAEYTGLAPAAGAGKGGNREAYFEMLASTANAADHATIAGWAPPGYTLRVHKQFQTPTSPVRNPDGTVGDPLLYADTLDSTFKPWTGYFRWAVNPSTRPYVAGRYGRNPTGPTQPALSLVNPAGVPAENTDSPYTGPHEEVPFTISGAPFDNGEAHVRIQWASPNTDWDLYVLDEAGNVVGQSAQGDTTFEDAVLIDPKPGNYKVIIVNFAGGATDDWTGGVTFAPPAPPVPGTTEAWTLTCERPGGQVVSSRQVTVGRGGTANVGDVCRVFKQR